MHGMTLREKTAAGLMLVLALLAGCTGGYPAPVGDMAGGPRYWDTGRTHRVNAGETLYAISLIYDADYRLLAQVNDLAEPYRLRPGDMLLVDVRGVTLRQQPPAVSGSTAVRTSPATSAGRVNSTPLPDSSSPVPANPSPQTPPVPAAPTQRASVPSVREPPTVSPSAPVPGNAPVSTWEWPVNGRVVEPFSSEQNGNKGIDIAGQRGDPVVAAATGEVVYAGSGLLRYGDFIIIKHNDTYLSAYAHNDRLLVGEGQKVQQGQKIAEMGSTGINNVRLHFEIRESGKPVDPQRFLP